MRLRALGLVVIVVVLGLIFTAGPSTAMKIQPLGDGIVVREKDDALNSTNNSNAAKA